MNLMTRVLGYRAESCGSNWELDCLKEMPVESNDTPRYLRSEMRVGVSVIIFMV
jgi:hypothetical protein